MNEKAGGKTRRNRRRVGFETTISLKIGDKTYNYDRTYDISMNGVFVSTAQPLDLGVEARFVMKLAVGMRSEMIKGSCLVVRTISFDDGLSGETPGPGMALKFTDMDDDSSAMLYQIIRHNQPAE